MSSHYPAVAARATNRCEYCRAPEGIFNFRFEVEHIIPSSAGGPDDEANLALACRSCNSFKSDCLASADPGTGEVVSLFHPRRQLRVDHSQAEPDSGVIRGKTAVGRATLARLRFNSATQLRARQLWARLGLFP